MSAAVSIKSKKAVVPLSKQHLTDCLLEYYPDPKKEAKLKEGETYGSSCSKAYRFAVEQGIAEEESYPYAMRRGTCKCTETMVCMLFFLLLASGFCCSLVTQVYLFP